MRKDDVEDCLERAAGLLRNPDFQSWAEGLEPKRVRKIALYMGWDAQLYMDFIFSNQVNNQVNENVLEELEALCLKYDLDIDSILEGE